MNVRLPSFISKAWMLILLILGALLNAIAVLVFQAPFDIAPGGVSGVAIILNSLSDGAIPMGVVILLGNIPIQILAYRILGGWRVIAGTIFAVVVYSLLIEFLTPYLAGQIVSEDRFLNALFGGIITGIGSGMILAAGGTLGGTSTLGRILQQRSGIPLSTSTLYTDGIVVGVAGLVFGWEAALYAMVALYVGGVTADYVLEGPSVIRTAVVITDHPRELAEAIITRIGRGVTAWEGTGMFTEQPRTILYVTISRSQVNELRRCVTSLDPNAFLVIGQGHTAYGHGFRTNPQARPMLKERKM